MNKGVLKQHSALLPKDRADHWIYKGRPNVYTRKDFFICNLQTQTWYL